MFRFCQVNSGFFNYSKVALACQVNFLRKVRTGRGTFLYNIEQEKRHEKDNHNNRTLSGDLYRRFRKTPPSFPPRTPFRLRSANRFRDWASARKCVVTATSPRSRSLQGLDSWLLCHELRRLRSSFPDLRPWTLGIPLNW